VILFSATIVTQLVNSAKANPIWHHNIFVGSVAPDENTEPPTISIVSTENKTMYNVDKASFSLNASVGDSSTATDSSLLRVYYTTDWQSNDTYVYYNTPPKSSFSVTINLTGIPEGNHTLTVYAIETGGYPLSVVVGPNGDTREIVHYLSRFTINSSLTVDFSVDTKPSEVSVLSVENKTYYSIEIQLDFTVSEKPSRIVYSLDGQKNVTINGNTTLTNLPYGEHNITVCATDGAGNVGASETIYFNIEEPFPALPITTASITSAAIVSAGLLFYFKKRKR